MTKKIMVVVAHADDEVFGCGGTLLKHRDAGDSIHVVTLTDGVSSRGSQQGQGERESALVHVCKKLNASFASFQFNDNAMDSHSLLDIVQCVESEIAQFQPEVIYTHHSGDLNIDHQICQRAVLTACRPQPGFCVKTIYSFEVNSATEWNTPNSTTAFMPNVFVDISAHANEKIELLELYQTELRAFPHTRSIKALQAKGTVRGSSVGLESAEAFVLLRQVLS